MLQALGADAAQARVTLRSMLFVPADSERKLAKAAAAGADALILDFEDSVLAERKPAARRMACDYLRNHSAATPLWVRIDDLASSELLKDLAAVIPARPCGTVLPKIRGPEDLTTATHYPEMLEESQGELSAALLLRASRPADRGFQRRVQHPTLWR